MPFDPPSPRSFTVPSVREHAPALSGVYGISNAGEWIYIGESDNVQAALLQHVQELKGALLKQRPTGFVFELCDRALRRGRQDRLILEYEPTSNRHWERQRRIDGAGG